jgi:DNA-binding transcriptional ArsR family regulator
MEIDYEEIGRALIHPIQKAILDCLIREADVGPVSPLEIAAAADIALSRVSYHVKVLGGKLDGPFKGRPLLKLAKTEQRRGAIKHYYSLTSAAVK